MRCPLLSSLQNGIFLGAQTEELGLEKLRNL